MLNYHAGIFFVGTTAERTALVPRNGSAFYDTDEDKFYDYFDGWVVRGSTITLDADAELILDITAGVLGLDTQLANTLFAGPSTGAANEPTFRALVFDDLPITNLDTRYINAFTVGVPGFDRMYGELEIEKFYNDDVGAATYQTLLLDTGFSVNDTETNDAIVVGIYSKLTAEPLTTINGTKAIAGLFQTEVAGSEFYLGHNDYGIGVRSQIIVDVDPERPPSVRNYEAITTIEGESDVTEWMGLYIQEPTIVDVGTMQSLYAIYIGNVEGIGETENYSVFASNGTASFNQSGHPSSNFQIKSGGGVMFFLSGGDDTIAIGPGHIAQHTLDVKGETRIYVDDETINSLIVEYNGLAAQVNPSIVTMGLSGSPFLYTPIPKFTTLGHRIRLYHSNNGDIDDHPTEYSRFVADFDSDGVSLLHERAGAGYTAKSIVVKNNDASVPVLVVKQTFSMATNVMEWRNAGGTVQLAIASNARDFVLDTTTGTKIGTATSQKLGFWNATPVVQPSHIADPSGGAVIDTESRAAIVSILNLLESIGVMAP